MAASWPSGVPFKLLRDGAAFIEGEVAVRSDTDSGFQRQRAEFSAALDGVSGSIRMTFAEYETFRAWRKDLGGGAFDWPGHPSGETVTARFVAGEQGESTADAQTHKLLVPVRMEFL